MEIITITKENLEKEHICCAISSNGDCQVRSKKEWLAARLEDGLTFKKCNVRGKCFIEYIPAEKAWAPIDANGFMYIDCLWVAGQFKGQGYARLLMDECIRDSRKRGFLGIAALSSKKKQGFLSDPGFLKHCGFSAADTALPQYELLYLPFDSAAQKPKFKEQAKKPHTNGSGFELYYTHQCPYTAKYVPIIESIAKEGGIAFKSILLETAEQAQAAPSPFTTYSIFYNGKFITHEIQSDKKFIKLVNELVPAAGL